MRRQYGTLFFFERVGKRFRREGLDGGFHEGSHPKGNGSRECDHFTFDVNSAIPLLHTPIRIHRPQKSKAFSLGQNLFVRLAGVANFAHTLRARTYGISVCAEWHKIDVVDCVQHNGYDLMFLQPVEHLVVIAVTGNQACLHNLRCVVDGVVRIILIHFQHLRDRRAGQERTTNPVFDCSSVYLWSIDLLDWNLTFANIITSLVLIEPEKAARGSILRIKTSLKRGDVALICSFDRLRLFGICDCGSSQEKCQRNNGFYWWHLCRLRATCSYSIIV